MAAKIVKQLWPLALLPIVIVVAVLYPMWRAAVDRNQDARADPHHIAGGLYFVGDPAVTSFLLTGPDEDVLIGGGSPNSAHKIIDNITQLGFDIRKVRVLLATDGPFEYAGALAELQKASGAELWASDTTAAVLAAGGRDDQGTVYAPYRLLKWAGIERYPPPRVDHRVHDGDIVRLGPLALTAHITGFPSGCTTWTFDVHDRGLSTTHGPGRDLHVVHRCDLQLPPGASLVDPQRPPGIRENFERTLRELRALPVDVWLTTHGKDYGRFRKYEASLHADDPVAPFIDREGYLKSIDDAEAKFRAVLAEQERQR